MKIEKQEHGKKGAFYIEKDGDWIAELTFIREGQRVIVIDHTEVHPALKGKGIGKKLVETAVKYARKNDLLIRPVCPFAKKFLESSEEYEDVITR